MELVDPAVDHDEVVLRSKILRMAVQNECRRAALAWQHAEAMRNGLKLAFGRTHMLRRKVHDLAYGESEQAWTHGPATHLITKV
jgi:hypothetical protein